MTPEVDFVTKYVTDLGTGGEQINHTDQVAQMVRPFQITQNTLSTNKN